MTVPDQPSLFGGRHESLPEGFKYQAELISPEQEQELLGQLQALPFKKFEFQGFLGKRRVVSFGWRYNFNERELQKAEDMPPFLVPLAQSAADFAGLRADDLRQVLITEYTAGAGIGWHRDKAAFADVIGISLVSACRFRFRRKSAGKWQRVALIAAPRSAYLLTGPSRTEWEHSIPPMDNLRYSITFRSFVEKE